MSIRFTVKRPDPRLEIRPPAFDQKALESLSDDRTLGEAFVKSRETAKRKAAEDRARRREDARRGVEALIAAKERAFREEQAAGDEEDQEEVQATMDVDVDGAGRGSGSGAREALFQERHGDMPQSKRVRFCVVCASNNNRSMAAHKVMQEHDLNVVSAGTGSSVRLPGASANSPNIFEFGTPYERMFRALQAQNERLYMKNGILPMLRRNSLIKPAPERWTETGPVDVVICCEERCFESVHNDVLSRPVRYHVPLHIINVEIKDDVETAKRAGGAILMLSQLISAAPDYEARIPEFIAKVRQSYPHPIMHAVAYY